MSLPSKTNVMRIMATGGFLLMDETCNETVSGWKENWEDIVKKFNYKLSFYLNFSYRHAFDDQNNLRHALPSIEYTKVTDWWDCWVFIYILSISKVTKFLILHYFVYCELCQEGRLRHLSFVRSWCGNLLTIHTLGNRRKGLSYLQTPFIGWWMHQGTH